MSGTHRSWPDIESAVEISNDYLCKTLDEAHGREQSRIYSRHDAYKTRAKLRASLRRYGLADGGLKAEMADRLTAHEATLLIPPFIVVTDTLTFEFLQLPNDVRNMVYKELLTLEGVVFPGIVNILRANKQIYSEAKDLFYSLNTIQIEIDGLDRMWLREFNRQLDISISHRQHYSIGRASPNKWLELPTYLGRCEKIKIILSTVGFTHWYFRQRERLTSEKLNTMLMHFNSLVYTQLVKHEHLHSIHVELEFTRGHTPRIFPNVTEEQFQEFEQACLNSLGHIRGMRAVHLKGFKLIDPSKIVHTKQAMLLPSSDWWTSYLTMPKAMKTAPQWWQLSNLSIQCNPSGRYVATTHNLGDVTFIAFQKPTWHSLTHATLTPQTNEIRSYHASIYRRHLEMLAALLQPPPPPLLAPAPSLMKRRTLEFHQALVAYWDCL